MIIKPSIPHGHLELALRLFEPDSIEVSGRLTIQQYKALFGMRFVLAMDV